MAIGHYRLNEKETWPNKNINWIKGLPDFPNASKAIELLKSLAAQMAKLMRVESLGITSLEEAAWNPEFAGRNWNGGEIVELVLRRPDGSFYPTGYLLLVFCHELAHIRHMNHSRDFHKYNAALRQLLAQHRASGYTGDGLYSSGQQLGTGVLVGGIGEMVMGDMPEHLCGGAKYKEKASSGKAKSKKKRKLPSSSTSRKVVVPNLHTGAQTSPNRTASRPVRSARAFPSTGGHTLGDNKAKAGARGGQKGPVVGKGGRTQAKSAAALRADAFEAKLRKEKGLPDGKLNFTSGYSVKPKAEKDDERPVASTSKKPGAGPPTKKAALVGSSSSSAKEVVELESSSDGEVTTESSGNVTTEEEDEPVEEESEEQAKKDQESNEDVWRILLEQDGFCILPNTSEQKAVGMSRGGSGGSTSTAAGASSGGEAGKDTKGKGKQKEVIEIDDSD